MTFAASLKQLVRRQTTAAATARGGNWGGTVTEWGAFSLDLSYSPALWTYYVGFRCVIPSSR